MARILMVLRPSEGGAFEHVSSLSSELGKRGHEVAICGPHAHHADLDVEVIPVEIVRPLSPIADLRAILQLAAAIRRFRPDLIHAHGSKGGVMARLARAASPRTPLVFTPHGYTFAAYFTSRWEQRAYRMIERAMAPLATRVLCVCEAERRLAAAIGAAGRTRVVHNGIEPPGPGNKPDPAVARLREHGPVICAITGLRPGKGVETLIDAMPIVLREAPEATLVIAGDGRQRDALERRIVGLGLERSIELPGEVPDVEAVLQASDLFVSPSWAESFPFSVLEAMAMERPIVATNVGGVGEAIEDGVTGHLVAARDPAALATAVRGLLSDRNLAASLAQGARTRMMERFTLSRMVEGTVAVYGELGV